MTTIEQQLKTLPTQPGVYLYYNAEGQVLYVGKAKILRQRVRSYFQPRSQLDPAKQQMISQVVRLDTIATDTEQEALVLEANLIQKHQPPYNVILRDDKYYLFIKITRDTPPRIFPVRRLRRDGARYFGPYSSAYAVRSTLKLLRRIFPFAEEKDRPGERIFPHPLFAQDTKPTPLGSVSQDTSEIIRFLQGHRQPIMERLRLGMRQAAKEQAYERARVFRDQLQALERLEGSQKVYLPRRPSFDVISIAQDANRSAANVFAIRQGKLLQKNTFLLRHRASAVPADVLRQFLLQYYRVAQDIPATILLPQALPDSQAIARWINPEQPPTFHVPSRGQKRQLVIMGETNARGLLTTEQSATVSQERLRQASEDLGRALGIEQPLRRVEIYDISNTQGELPTASMVVFEEGQAKPSQYRKFRLRSLTTPNDFAALQEALSRRFGHAHPDWPQPNLIIIDGGKGQLSAARRALTTLGLHVPVIAIAKRQEEIFLPDQAQPLRLPYTSDALYLIQRMRDEAHRFTISYHRLLRSKKQQRSLLQDIPGIGPKTRRQLLRHFGSVQSIRQANQAQLTAIIGAAKAKILQDYL